MKCDKKEMYFVFKIGWNKIKETTGVAVEKVGRWWTEWRKDKTNPCSKLVYLKF